MRKTRIAKWDNIRFFMILCVVTGHTIYEFIGNHTDTAKSVYLFIYTFHIPVLIFVTGIFSRHSVERKRYDRVIQYLFIYLVMKFLDFLGTGMTSRIKREDFLTLRFFTQIREGLATPRQSFHLFWEDGPGWFALAVAVYLLLTILIREADRRVVLTAALTLGCLAGLDNHLGDHFASMRICTFYPVFLAGFYLGPEGYPDFTGHSSDRQPGPGNTGRKKSAVVIFRGMTARILSAALLLAVFLVCLARGNELYRSINFLKGKRDYMSLGMGVKGVILRLLCYGLWALLIIAVITLAPRKEYFWTWLGRRTLSIFIWHKFILTIILKLCFGKHFIKYEMPHLYLPAAICLAVIVTVLSAYLPEFRVSDRTRREKKE
ncbi:MAG: hypothetical protein IKX76_05940 [Eubacterium sp.]|nr:hypothetical protein [Eubacterium sp.]